ncbi:MAG TPA: Ig-like domain-containing protein, partial [Longimicrobium sp.]|nr:Ig-like domain-containing protein [Longimicrobium sp.]
MASVLLMVPFAGCGGGSSRPDSAAGTGSAAFTVVWPERSRLIPLAAESIRIDIRRQDQSILATQVIVRPNTSAVFAALPVGALIAEARAFPNADGSGTVQARGSVALSIQAGQQTAVGLTMASTIARLEITAPGATVTRGRSVPLTATAYDAPTGGNVVLTLPDTLLWTSSDRTVAVVDGEGVVTGVSPGQATIEVQEIESGQRASIPITTLGLGIYVADIGNNRVVRMDTFHGGGFRTFGT